MLRNTVWGKRAAPYSVHLNRRNAYQPDIVFITTRNTHKIKRNGLHGAPDLVIEILSPASWHYDKGDKKDEYERSGVKQYWIVDPETKLAEGFWLVNNEYQPLPSGNGTILFRSFDLTISF